MPLSATLIIEMKWRRLAALRWETPQAEGDMRIFDTFPFDAVSKAGESLKAAGLFSSRLLLPVTARCCHGRRSQTQKQNPLLPIELERREYLELNGEVGRLLINRERIVMRSRSSVRCSIAERDGDYGGTS